MEFNHWELLSVTLPRPLSKLGVFPISNKRIGILGGVSSHWVFILQIEDLVEIGGASVNTVSGQGNAYTMEDGARPLD